MRGAVTLLWLVAALGAAQPEPPRPKLLLLTANFADPDKNFATFTLSWMARQQGTEYDAYYAADRGDGGIFSPHGSAMIGGRHEMAIAHALARFETTVVRLRDCTVFEPIIHAGARSVYRSDRGLIDLYEKFAGPKFPVVVVAIQTRGLPGGLQNIQPYLFPEVVQRNALALPLELDEAGIARLRRLGVRQVFTIAGPNASATSWQKAGFAVSPAEVLADSDSLFTVTHRLAKRWLQASKGIDLCEPLLASYWVPFSVRESRLQICSSPTTKEAVEAIETLLESKGPQIIYGRYAGGEAKGVDDIGLWPLFRRNFYVQVAEPGRPVLTVLGSKPAPFARSAKSWLDFEPSDAQLRNWARQGKILATWVLHSGELSHDDAVLNFIEFSALRKIPIGMGAHWQRFAFEPWSVESAFVPQSQGGALGLVEPVIHSTGHGIMAEKQGDAKTVAGLMRQARERIATLVGDQSAPRGVYCYLDANLDDWDERADVLWKAIQTEGFEYVISSVSSGRNKVLYHDRDFIVLNMLGRRGKFSPFVRFRTGEMEDLENRLIEDRKPGWLIGVLDVPLYGYNSYLPVGHQWGYFKRINELYDYLEKGAKERNLVPATPHTVARYARVLLELGLIPQ